MVIANAQIFTWIGFNTATRRNAIINDFLQEGYEALRYMSKEDIKEMYLSYAKKQMLLFQSSVLQCKSRGLEHWYYGLKTWLEPDKN